jgi:hypothetical protein
MHYQLEVAIQLLLLTMLTYAYDLLAALLALFPLTCEREQGRSTMHCGSRVCEPTEWLAHRRTLLSIFVCCPKNGFPIWGKSP